MATDLPSVLHALPQLSPTDLQQVIVRAKLALSLDGKMVQEQPPPEEAPTEDFILEGIHYELRRRGLLGQESRLSKRIMPTTYVAASYEVRKLLRTHLPNLSRLERVALGQLAANCLASWLVKVRNRQIDKKVMLFQVGNIPVALDFCFPGYLRAGVLMRCWQR